MSLVSLASLVKIDFRVVDSMLVFEGRFHVVWMLVARTDYLDWNHAVKTGFLVVILAKIGNPVSPVSPVNLVNLVETDSLVVILAILVSPAKTDCLAKIDFLVVSSSFALEARFHAVWCAVMVVNCFVVCLNSCRLVAFVDD